MFSDRRNKAASLATRLHTFHTVSARFYASSLRCGGGKNITNTPPPIAVKSHDFRGSISNPTLNPCDTEPLAVDQKLRSRKTKWIQALELAPQPQQQGTTPPNIDMAKLAKSTPLLQKIEKFQGPPPETGSPASQRQDPFFIDLRQLTKIFMDFKEHSRSDAGSNFRLDNLDAARWGWRPRGGATVWTERAEPRSTRCWARNTPPKLSRSKGTGASMHREVRW
ncbi:hypothetical protein BJ508DRAFT_310657 [Ascobolus immersus RN42]|uniref:Uncharacterized protein n=1 Tax=Ascobolus immersus RN42 TaxID=1160509 RepID=A0A3N4HWM0_ASCIM|nr:hypothetical protein BJ508DRAFT_310657 [Ascobolus immersus RN42]